MFKTIKYSLDDRVATISFNRPDSYNAFNKIMREEFLLAIKKAKKRGIKVITDYSIAHPAFFEENAILSLNSVFVCFLFTFE